MNRRTRALIRAGGGRLVASVVTLRSLGGRYVVGYDRAHVRAVEHAFTTHRGHDLDLLQEIALAMPHLRFADFWARTPAVSMR